MKERCYNPRQVLESDALEAKTRAILRPFSSCLEKDEGAVVGTMYDFYLGHLETSKIKELYGHEVRVVYFTGEYGEQEGRIMTRVSYGVVEPHTVVDID